MIQAANATDVEQFMKATSYRPTEDFKGVKLVREGELVAMAGYDFWTPNAVQMHIWIPKKSGFTREFIREGLRYPFQIGNRKLIVGVTPGDNLLALEFNRRIGFVQKYRVKDGWSDGVDMVLQELRREDCRWLGE